MSGIVCVCPIAALRHIAVNIVGYIPQRNRVATDGHILVEIISYERVCSGIKTGANRVTNIVVFMRFVIAIDHRSDDFAARVVAECVVIAGDWAVDRVERVS